MACSCFRLNSLQMTALLSQEKIHRNLIDTAIRMAESVADELTRGDDREVGHTKFPECNEASLPFMPNFSNYVYNLLLGMSRRAIRAAIGIIDPRRWIQFGCRAQHSRRLGGFPEPIPGSWHVPSGCTAN